MLTDMSVGDVRHLFAGDGLVGRWIFAVEAGARGEGAAAMSALTELGVAARMRGDRAFASLAASTTASLYRQAGRHGIALGHDGRATSLVDANAATTVGWMRAALCDALVNLAADNLGLGRFGASRRLLCRAEEALDDTARAWRHTRRPQDTVMTPSGIWLTETRCRLRVLWVRAELAMYTANSAAALQYGQRAVALCEEYVQVCSLRHRIKTDLIVAAAHATAADTDVAMAEALRLRDDAADAGLFPLCWAALVLARGLGDNSARTASEISEVHRFMHAQGMPFVTLTPDR